MFVYKKDLDMRKLLLIDDDEEVLAINQKYFSGEGFSVSVTGSPFYGIQYVKKNHPDCILLDIMMPGMDGIQFCSEIRKFSDTPIIFLTGQGSEEDKIQGLMSGADDYIVKPYSLREVKARIDAVLRRRPYAVPQGEDANCIVFHNLSIDLLAHKAFYKGEDLGLSNREYEVLLYFAQNPYKEVTFEELGTDLFGCYQDTDRRSVMVNVSRLRKKMNVDFESENMIETVWSKGYKFIPT